MGKDKELGIKFVWKQSSEETPKKVATELSNVSKHAKEGGENMERLVRAMERLGATEALGKVGSSMATGLGGSPTTMLALAGIGIPAGIFAEMSHLVTETADLSAEILRNSGAIGMNTESYQTWMRIGDQVGISHEQLFKNLNKLNIELANGAPSLQAVGLSLKDLGVTSTDTGASLTQLANYFSHSTNEAAKAAAAQALFGKGGAAWINVLNQGAEAVAAYQKHLEEMGLILDANQLRQGALTKAVGNEFKDALEGITLQVGTRMQQGFILLWETMVKVAGGGKQLFNALGEAVGNVVAFIAGALGQLFGVKVSMEDLQKVVDEGGGKFQNLGVATDEAADSADNYGNVNKRLIDGLNNTIRSLSEEQRAYDQVNAAQQKDIDLQVKQLDLIQRQRDEAERLRKAKETVANDQLAISKDQTDLEQAMFEGNVSKSLAANDTLTAAKQKLADDQIAIANDQFKAETDAAKTALQDKKTALQQEKTDRDEAYQLRIQQLRDEVTAHQQAQSQMVLASSNASNAYKTTASDFKTFWEAFNKGTAKTWADKAAEMVESFKGFITQIQLAAQENGISGVFMKLGEMIGEAIIGGAAEGLYKKNPMLAKLVLGDEGVEQVKQDIHDRAMAAQVNKDTAALTAPAPKGPVTSSFNPVTGETTYNIGGKQPPHEYMATGGTITEPIFGVGQSGKTYSFGEGGKWEDVVPRGSGGGNAGHNITINVVAGVGAQEIADTIAHRVAIAIHG